ncbi:MAG TPA: chromate transporter [Lachnospiraceae bacterium]|jgi:chromate transporter|nr:chromate transporter [Lachnospiraceae bacterium]
MNKGWSFYRKLFTSTFYLSAFTFGGGYVIVPLMKKKFVDELKWIEEKEMLDMVAIAQSAPGVIAVNTSIMLGYRLAGISGAFITVLGTVLPPLIILSVISLFYAAFKENAAVHAVLKGMSAGVAALIADVTVNMSKNIIKEKNIFSILIMAVTFCAVFFFNVDVMYVLLISGVIGILYTLYRMSKNRGNAK